MGPFFKVFSEGCCLLYSIQRHFRLCDNSLEKDLFWSSKTMAPVQNVTSLMWGNSSGGTELKRNKHLWDDLGCLV